MNRSIDARFRPKLKRENTPAKTAKHPKSKNILWETVSHWPFCQHFSNSFCLILQRKIHSTLWHLQVIGRSTPGTTQAWHVRPRLAHVFQAKMYFYTTLEKLKVRATLCTVLVALMELLVFMFCWFWWSMENATFCSCFHFQFHLHLRLFWKSCFSKTTYHGRCLHKRVQCYLGRFLFTPSSFAWIWQRMSSQWNPLQDLVRIAEQLHHKKCQHKCVQIRFGQSWLKIYLDNSWHVIILPSWELIKNPHPRHVWRWCYLFPR